MSTTNEISESDQFFEPALLIPIKGKVYRIEPLSAENVLFLRNNVDAVTKAQNEGKDLSEVRVEGIGENDTPEESQRRVFGDTYDELVADGVSAVALYRMSQVIMIWAFSGIEAAKAYVATGGKALTLPNREERRKTATRTRTGAANTTRSAKSASGTSTRKATATKASPGTKSSATGTPSKQTSKTLG